jgi:hypothetical protein
MAWNQDYKYKLKNIGVGSLGAPYGSSKAQKASKLEKQTSKWATSGYIFVLSLKSKQIKPQMACNM